VPLLAPDPAVGSMVVYSTSPCSASRTMICTCSASSRPRPRSRIDNSSLYGQRRPVDAARPVNNVATILGGTLDLRQILDFVRTSAEAVAGATQSPFTCGGTTPGAP